MLPTVGPSELFLRTSSHGHGMLQAWFRNWNASTVSAVWTRNSNISHPAYALLDRNQNKESIPDASRAKPFLSLSCLGAGDSVLEDNGTCKYPDIPKSKWREDFTTRPAWIKSRLSRSQQSIHTDHEYFFFGSSSPQTQLERRVSRSRTRTREIGVIREQCKLNGHDCYYSSC